jgi:hypothetical protein
MKRSSQAIGGLGALLVLMAGCGSASPPVLGSQTTSAHALAGYPPLPPADQPASFPAQPFGLFASAPTPATLTTLARGVTSPDGRFRAALTAQGAWAVRVDGAWFWQIELPVMTPAITSAKPGGQAGTPTAAGAQAGQSAAQLGQTPAPPTQAATGLGGWTPLSHLLVQAPDGSWFDADPLTATVTPLAPLWQGRTGLQVSPDGKQILYSQTGPKGPQVWLANIDGTRPTLLADNATATWGLDGKPAITPKPGT